MHQVTYQAAIGNFQTGTNTEFTMYWNGLEFTTTPAFVEIVDIEAIKSWLAANAEAILFWFDEKVTISSFTVKAARVKKAKFTFVFQAWYRCEGYPQWGEQTVVAETFGQAITKFEKSKAFADRGSDFFKYVLISNELKN